MRFLELSNEGELQMIEEFIEEVPHYAILSHMWRLDVEEVTFTDMQTGHGRNKPGYQKLLFCARQARRDGLLYCWVDTCCINKTKHPEPSEAITSMFRWYQNAVECYVYLADVPSQDQGASIDDLWEFNFHRSKWFKRGWTLQELLAPRSVKFYSQNQQYLGNKRTLEQQIYVATEIPISALRGAPPGHFTVEERMRWTKLRSTKRREDRAYCLLGLFGVFIPLIYGEGDNAFVRLQEAIDKKLKDRTKADSDSQFVDANESNTTKDDTNSSGQPSFVKYLPPIKDVEHIRLDPKQLETLDIEDQNNIVDIVISNCQNACFEFYKFNSLWEIIV